MLSSETRLRLFRLALRYKKTRLWTVFTDQNLFAVRLPDGEIGYCCVMGQEGSHVSLALYIGQEGISTYLGLLEDTEFFDSPGDDNFQLLKAVSQKCLQCTFDDEEFISKEQLREAKNLARTLGVSLRAPFRYPHFDRYAPMCMPVPIQEEKDAIRLMTALHGAIFVHSRLKESKPLDVPFFADVGEQIPLLVPSRDAPNGFLIQSTVIPERIVPTPPSPSPLDEITMARLRKCKPDGTWDCAIACFPSFALEGSDAGQITSGPVTLNRNNRLAIPAPAIGIYDEDPSSIFRDYVNGLINHGTRPTRIRVHTLDLRGQAFFSVLATQLRIPIEVVDSLPELNDAIDALNASEDEVDDQMEEIYAFLSEATPAEIRMLPSELKVTLRAMVRTSPESIPKEIRNKLIRVLGP